MTNRILLVFEGEVSEKVVWQSLNKFYFADVKSPIVYSVYCSHIYSLYSRMKADPDLDLFAILQQNPKNSDLLKGLLRDDVSEIYLFFDYDGHDPQATDEKLQEMLDFFHEETEHGKLYISYPMVEAFRHLHPDVCFAELVTNGKANIRYKGVVHKEGLPIYGDIPSYTAARWEYVIQQHCMKMNNLVYGVFDFPNNYVEQRVIFENQLEKHIDPRAEVAVLSAFPIFLLGYYGAAGLLKKLEEA